MLTRSCIVAMALLLTGCIGAGDIFSPEHRLVGRFVLWHNEFGDFKLGGPGKPAGDGGGYVEGDVDSLGWSETRLLVWRSRPTFGGDAPGWMIVDVASGQVSGPISAESRARNPELSRIPVRSASAVWRKPER